MAKSRKDSNYIKELPSAPDSSGLDEMELDAPQFPGGSSAPPLPDESLFDMPGGSYSTPEKPEKGKGLFSGLRSIFKKAGKNLDKPASMQVSSAPEFPLDQLTLPSENSKYAPPELPKPDVSSLMSDIPLDFDEAPAQESHGIGSRLKEKLGVGISISRSKGQGPAPSTGPKMDDYHRSLDELNKELSRINKELGTLKI